MECVPNFSEGRRKEVIDEIKLAGGICPGAFVLDCHSDADHNRMVLTIVGSSDPVKNAALSASSKAIELVDMRKHAGVHPRIGAVDVVPFVPLGDTAMEECIKLANEFAKEFADRFSVPVFLYGESARNEDRKSLAKVRAVQFESLRELIEYDHTRKPDYGPSKIHSTAGATAVGARRVLIAYNIHLNTNDISIAKKIANRIRESNGGLKGVQAMGVKLQKRGIAQVSTNITDYAKTSLETVFDTVSKIAAESKVEVVDSEIVGLAPRDSLPANAAERLKIFDFSADKIIENKVAKLEI